MADTNEPRLTHLAADGSAAMVDVGDKDDTVRIAEAEGFVRMKPETLHLILQGNLKKGRRHRGRADCRHPWPPTQDRQP